MQANKNFQLACQENFWHAVIRVKTDRRDSRKLANLLAKAILHRVWVPSRETQTIVR